MKINNIADNIINKISKKLKIDIRYFLRTGFWLSLSQFFILIKNFTLSVILAHFLTKEVYGQYAFIISMLSLSLMFALPGIGPSIIKSLSNNFYGTYKKAQRLIFLFSILGSLFLASISLYGYLNSHDFGCKLFLILALLFPFYSSSNLYNPYYISKNKFNIIAFINIINSITIIILVSLFLYLEKNIYWIILSLILSNIIIYGYFSFYHIRKKLDNNKIDDKAIKYSKKTALSKAYEMGAGHIDKILVTFFFGI